MTVDPYDVYKTYMAIKLHFESDSYDAVKYNYKTSVKPQSFFKRNDRYFFAKVGRKFKDTSEVAGFFTAHFVSDDSPKWVGNMLESEADYSEWLRKIQSLSYIFESDLSTLSMEADSFDDLFALGDSSPYPLVVSKYMSQEVNLETLVILDTLTGFMARADKEVTDTIVWPDLMKKVKKYSKILEFNTRKMKEIILKNFTH
jgi:hypothetical protein